MLNLFENYSQESWDLHYSMASSGFNHPTVVLNDDGFLPRDVTSPIQYYTGFTRQTGKPLYFNELPIPDYWEIKSTPQEASVWELDQKRANIYFVEGNPYRQIKEVEWLNREGKVFSKDYYNSSGFRFAQSRIDTQNNQKQSTSYFSKDNREVLVENHITDDIILNNKDGVFFFASKTEFILHYLKDAGFNTDRIFYNSLGFPFLVVYQLDGPGNDILFWQEEIQDQLPGNMRVLLDGFARSQKVVVQNKNVFEKINTLCTVEQSLKVEFAGYKFPFKRENSGKLSALIMTNSDQLKNIEALISQHPNIMFHIGALTEMSSHLLAIARFENVKLFPNISNAVVEKLFRECDIYMDINFGNEILSATREAFLNNMLVLSFEDTLHNSRYVAQPHIFKRDDIQGMHQLLSELERSPQKITSSVQLQKDVLCVEDIQTYKNIVGDISNEEK